MSPGFAIGSAYKLQFLFPQCRDFSNVPDMSDWRATVEPLVHHSKIKVPYTWSVGETGSKFLRALRDDKKILANKCPKTGQIFVPPKLNSPYSLEPITEWLELSGTGTVQTFTQRHYDSAAAPRAQEVGSAEPGMAKAEADAPRIYALILLDGSTQAFPHLLGEVDFKNVKAGMRVTAVFRENREGHILDIKYFKPV